MKKLMGLLLLSLSVFGASAQNHAKADYEDHNRVVNVNAEVRVDFQQDYLGEEMNKANSGFKGKYLTIALDGHINKHFYYAFRQRLNRMHKDESFFDATDWVYISYRPDEHWDISAGKQVVGIGGYEYDRSPIDLYFNSEYWNNINCYQLGVSVAYAIGEGNDRLMAQVCESPFTNHRDYMFAYNLMWYGKHDWFNTIYSLNATEFKPGEYIYYVVLGNEFKFGDFKLQLDYMNRAVDGHAFFFQDFSIMGEASYMIKDKVNVFAKATYDVNKTDVEGDYCVMPGTELTRVGAGVEYYPLSKGRKDLRLFAHYSYSWGVNGNLNGTVKDNQHFWGVGVKWDIDIISLTNKIFKKDGKSDNSEQQAEI